MVGYIYVLTTSILNLFLITEVVCFHPLPSLYFRLPTSFYYLINFSTSSFLALKINSNSLLQLKTVKGEKSRWASGKILVCLHLFKCINPLL